MFLADVTEPDSVRCLYETLPVGAAPRPSCYLEDNSGLSCQKPERLSNARLGPVNVTFLVGFGQKYSDFSHEDCVSEPNRAVGGR